MGMTLGIGRKIRIGGGGGAAKPDGAPLNLALVVDSDTAISGSFTIDSTNHDGHYAYYSTDNINFTRATNAEAEMIGTDDAFQITGLTANYYYIKVCAYKGTGLSAYCDVVINEKPLCAYSLLSTFGWYDYANPDTITKDGSNIVSRWNDQLGSGNDFVLGNCLWSETSGMVFRGSPDYLKTGAKTLVQPTFLYLAMEVDTWENSCAVLDGNAADTGKLMQVTSSGQWRFFVVDSYVGNETNLTNDTLRIVKILVNGASSKIQIDGFAAKTGTLKATGYMNGITLGAGGGLGTYTKPKIREIIARRVADTATNEEDITSYLRNKYTPLYPDKILFNATGTGAGVAVLRMKSSSDITVTLTGTGRFYTNAAGTTGESATWLLTAGAVRTIYLRVPSGSTEVTFSDITKVISWGDSVNDGLTCTTGCPSAQFDVAKFVNIQSLAGIGYNAIFGSIDTLSSLIYLSLNDNTLISGDVSNINTAITVLNVTGANSLTGDVSQLVNLTNLVNHSEYSSLYGDITDLIHLTQLYTICPNTAFSGDCSGLTAMTFMELRGSAIDSDKCTITGSISGMTNLFNYWCTGVDNTMGGDISGLVHMTHFYNKSAGTSFSGTIDALTSLVTMTIGGLSTVGGNLGAVADRSTVTSIVFNVCRIIDYTAGVTWGIISGGNFIINPSTGYGLSATEVDNILIDLNNNTRSGIIITLQGANTARTSASDAAVTALQGRGCTVNTN